MQRMFEKIKRYQFLYEELVKRDFKKKYKRTVLGMAWSVLSPLISLMVMSFVFGTFFKNRTEQYTIYLLCGNLLFSYFSDSTNQGMTALMDNANIFSKINVPKFLFLVSKNTETLINFGLTMIVFVIFCIFCNIKFTWKFIMLLYPVACMLIFVIGVGLILSALFVFFRDIKYLWTVFLQLLQYASAIFYPIDSFSEKVQMIFLLNPVYLFIRYFRKIVIEAEIPTVWFHLLMGFYAILSLTIGIAIYRKYDSEFLYYV